MELSAERAARNDAVFRTANDGIRAAAERHGMEDRIPFLCECADTGCTTIVQLSLSEYREVRAHPRRFLVAPAHTAGQEETTSVVARGDGYEVIEKADPAAGA
jgi:hypothetical protein